MVKSANKPDKAKPYDRPSYQLTERAKGGKKADALAAASAQVAADDFVTTSAKGKGKASAGADAGAAGASMSLTGAVNIGAPSQVRQSSRKGKKAWRKNVDMADVDRAMEEAREEERVTGGKVGERRNEALFEVDVTGDAVSECNTIAAPPLAEPERRLRDAYLTACSGGQPRSQQAQEAPSIPCHLIRALRRPQPHLSDRDRSHI